MKANLYITLIILNLLGICSQAQSTVLGYYVINQNDTIHAEIQLQKGVFGQIINDFKNGVKFINSSGVAKKYSPGDIKSFGFVHKDILTNTLRNLLRTGPLTS